MTQRSWSTPTAPIDGVIDDDDDVVVAGITIAELLVSVETMTARTARRRQQFADDLKDGIPIVGYDATVACSHAQSSFTRRRGRPRRAHLIVAATAAATQREVGSADLFAFRDLPGRHRQNASVVTHRTVADALTNGAVRSRSAPRFQPGGARVASGVRSRPHRPPLVSAHVSHPGIDGWRT